MIISIGGKSTTSLDIRGVYLILLGREPDEPYAFEGRLGLALSVVLRDILDSSEFKEIYTNIVLHGVLPHTLRLNSSQLIWAITWWEAAFRPFDSPAFHSWWRLIDSILTSKEISELMPRDTLKEVQVATSTHAKQCQELTGKLQPFFDIDYKWLTQADPLSLYELDVEESLERHVIHAMRNSRPVLPAFTEGIESVYSGILEKPFPTPRDVLVSLSSGLALRTISHWLFSELYYLYQLRHTYVLPNELEPPGYNVDTLGPYCHFLIYGDSRRISPHPLFDYMFYREYNDLPPDHLFRDYVYNTHQSRRTSSLFDPDFYLLSNPSVQLEILNKEYSCPLHHFVKIGIYDNLQFSPDFDVNYYLQRYPEISTAIANREIPSASWHFLFHGLREGRQPNPYFDPHYYRERYPLVKLEMKRLGIASELEHFLILGRKNGYKATPPMVDWRPNINEAKSVFQRRARRHRYNMKRTRLNFSAFTHTNPDVSIIIPVSNEIEFTGRMLVCLYFACSFAFHSQAMTSQIVIVNNGSSDGTAELLQDVSGVIVLTYEQQMGFPRAVNEGVAKSTGKLIIVANNDIEFEPDALLMMCERLAADSSIGIVGGVTLLANETLQEAGSFVTSRGATIGLGRGDDPWDMFYEGVYEADYCTGSMIAFRRVDFDTLKGFDEAFSPGYYEETDFSFRMRSDLNKRSVVDSSIQIVHFEHASFAKGRPPSAVAVHIRRNQERFVVKHSEALTRYPAASKLITAAGVSPTAIRRSRVLVIEDQIPDARLGSGFSRSAQIVDQISAWGVACDLIALNPSEIVHEFHDRRVRIYKAWITGQSPNTILDELGGRYTHVIVCRSHNLRRLGHMLESAQKQYGIKIICDTEGVTVSRALERDRISGIGGPAVDMMAAIRAEFLSPCELTAWIAVNQYDKRLLENAGLSPAFVVGHSHPELPRSHDKTWEERDKLLLVGSIHETGAPNHDGIRWFLDRVYPRCSSRVKELKLIAVGYWVASVREDFRERYADLDYAGVVDQRLLETLYGESLVAIAPTRFAAGLPHKVTEAMAMGTPIVMTDLLERQVTGSVQGGLSGLAVGQRDDDGASFAAWIDRLAESPDIWDNIRKVQMEIVHEDLSPDKFRLGLRSLFGAVGISLK